MRINVSCKTCLASIAVVTLAAAILFFVLFQQVAAMRDNQFLLFSSFSGIPYDVISGHEVSVLLETGSMEESTDPHFWLNSGGMYIMSGNIGSTIHGELPMMSYWRAIYAQNNPVDTDGGLHPQNLFRLITRDQLPDPSSQSASFYASAYNNDQSINIDPSNGIFIFSHYIDGDNFYYGGIRADGAAVIKKKVDGFYQTLAYETIFGDGSYVQGDNAIPLQQWIPMTFETFMKDGHLEMMLKVQGPNAEERSVYASDTDWLAPGFGGVRSDFFDMKLREYSVQ